MRPTVVCRNSFRPQSSALQRIAQRISGSSGSNATEALAVHDAAGLRRWVGRWPRSYDEFVSHALVRPLHWTLVNERADAPCAGGRGDVSEYAYLGMRTVVGTELPQPDVFGRRWTKNLTSDVHFYDVDAVYDESGNITRTEDNLYTAGTAGSGDGFIDVAYAMHGVGRGCLQDLIAWRHPKGAAPHDTGVHAGAGASKNLVDKACTCDFASSSPSD